MKKLLILLLLVGVLLGALTWITREQPAVQVEIPPDATEVLTDPRFVVPDGWQWATLETPSAGTIRWGHLAVPAEAGEPRGVVVFLPGYSAPLNIYFETFSRMTDAGYAVVGLDWPSQGGSSRPTGNPQKIHATTLDHHVTAGVQTLVEASALYPDLPMFVVGLSMGAQLGTRMLATPLGQGVDAAALITPAYGLYGNRPNGVERALLGTLSAIGLGERYAPGSTDWVYDMDVHTLTASACSHPNARTRLWYAWMIESPELRVGGMSNDFVRALVSSADLAASESVLSQVSIPVWMPLAEDDTFVDNAKAERACEQLPNCESQTYAQARHCLFEEADAFYEPFMEDLLAFLDHAVELANAP